MRNFLWAISLCCLVIVFVTCKSLTRQPHSEIRAVSDAQLTLGLVPIQRDDDMRAYRLLVCKKAGTYPPQLLADDNHCRIALLDENSTEVVFWPNDFKRDFATKYKGYIKHAVFATIAIVPLALVGRFAGGWKITKLVKKDRSKAGLALKDFAGGKFTSKLIDKGIGNNGLMFYHGAWYVRFNEIFTKIAQSSDVAEIQAEIKAFAALTDMFGTAAELKALGDSKRIFAEVKALPTDKVKARIDRLQDDIVDANGSTVFSEEGTFTNIFLKDKRHYQELITAATAEGITLDEMKVLAAELRKAAEIYGEGLPLYEELYGKSNILRIVNSGDYQHMDLVLDEINKNFAQKQAELLADEDDVLRLTAEMVNVADKARRNAGMYTLGGGGLGISIISAIDKSIWGYADRQLNQHWNQIFVDNDDFGEAQPVLDIRFILKALADEFDFVVNERALQLAEET